MTAINHIKESVKVILANETQRINQLIGLELKRTSQVVMSAFHDQQQQFVHQRHAMKTSAMQWKETVQQTIAAVIATQQRDIIKLLGYQQSVFSCLQRQFISTAQDLQSEVINNRTLNARLSMCERNLHLL